MNQDFLLFEAKEQWKFNLPLTYFKPLYNIISGILSIRQKWEHIFNRPAGILTRDYLMEKYGQPVKASLFIPDHILPDAALVEALQNLPPQSRLTDHENRLLGFRLGTGQRFSAPDELYRTLDGIEKHIIYPKPYKAVRRPYDLVFLNQDEISADLARIQPRAVSCPEGAECFGKHPVYLRGKQQIHKAVFDLTEGPVFLDDDVKILPGSYIKGPAAVLGGSMVKAGTRIYNGTTLGPWTKVGGEIKNVLFQGYANKGHDGFLGDAVIGNWCNFGAGSSNSNLKNNYSDIQMWNIGLHQAENTGKMFLGLIMGDHSKCAINTSFNTGTVVGVCANIFTRDFPPKFVSSFNWGGADFNHDYAPDKAIETARVVYGRRHVDFTEADEKIFRKVYAMVKEME